MHCVPTDRVTKFLLEKVEKKNKNFRHSTTLNNRMKKILSLAFSLSSFNYPLISGNSTPCRFTSRSSQESQPPHLQCLRAPKSTIFNILFFFSLILCPFYFLFHLQFLAFYWIFSSLLSFWNQENIIKKKKKKKTEGK